MGVDEGLLPPVVGSVSGTCGVTVGVTVAVVSIVGVGVGVSSRLLVGLVGVGVGVSVRITCVGVSVGVTVGVLVGVIGVGVFVGVSVGVGVGVPGVMTAGGAADTVVDRLSANPIIAKPATIMRPKVENLNFFIAELLGQGRDILLIALSSKVDRPSFLKTMILGEILH